jgi:RTX calcium-binding nonapeptide repeat (4 copies)
VPEPPGPGLPRTAVLSPLPRIPARRGALLLALAAACALAAPAAAGAATVTLDGTALLVAAAPGETNRLTVTVAADQVTVADAGAGLGLSPACWTSAPGALSCSRAGIERLAVALGDGDDTLTVAGSLPITVDDGAGADVVTGGGGADTLGGGDGADTVNGGAGDDVLLAGAGADVLNGGSGRDRADYATRTTPVALDADGVADDGGPGEADLIAADVEDLTGGAAGDTLTGTAAANTLRGGPGADRQREKSFR